MAYSKSSPNNKFAPSTVVSMASKTSNRPMSYGQVYENINYEMGMHKISDTDRKWMACRKNFINSNRRAFEELQIKVGNLIEAGKIPPNYANNLDKICTEDEFNSIQAEVNNMESSRAIDRTGHFRDDSPKKSAEAATVVTDNEIIGGSDSENENSGDESDYSVLGNYVPNSTKKNKNPRTKKVLSKEEKERREIIKINKKNKLAENVDRSNIIANAKEKINFANEKFKMAKETLKNKTNDDDTDTLNLNIKNAESELTNAKNAYNDLTETFNDKVLNKVDKKINERKDKSKEKKKAAIAEDVAILENADKILLKNVPETNVITKLGEIKIKKITKIEKKQQETTEVKPEEIEKRKRNRLANKTKKENIKEDVKIGVEAAKELAVQDGLLIRTVKGKYIANINKNDIGTLRKVFNEKKNFTISGHVKSDITVVGKNTNKPKYVLRKNKVRAANNNWSESLKLLKGNNVKMVGPDKFNEKFNNAKDEDKEKLLKNLQNYITVMGDYIEKLPDNDETKPIKQAKLNEAKELLEQYNTQTAPQAATEVDYTAQKRADAQRISAMDRDYRQSFQAAYQQKPFKADRYKLGSSDMHDWPSSAGSSVSSNRDSWYAEWNANRSY